MYKSLDSLVSHSVSGTFYKTSPFVKLPKERKAKRNNKLEERGSKTNVLLNSFVEPIPNVADVPLGGRDGT